MKKLTSKEIRNIWIQYFKNKDHYEIPSASLIPIEDESILWINSGVATLKKVFEGKKQPPSKRMVSIQKSLRTGDFDNVGITSRHHTFFEMMGNFSIGDYFKEEAISFAFEILTSPDYYDIPKEKIFITIFKGDKDSLRYWLKLGISQNHIFKMGKSTNFWDMGKGPSGPSTEIFFDRGEKFSDNSAKNLISKEIENDRYIEIWNIVFSQFNNDGKGKYTELPQKNIDTGAGLERFASCFQEVPTDFETDLFAPIIKKIEEFSKKKYQWEYVSHQLEKNDNEQFLINSAYKKIADYTRAITFALADGAMPGPNGRGYVLRKLIRQAILQANKLEITNDFLYKLPPVIVKIMEDIYPNVKTNLPAIIEIFKREEKSFKKLLNSTLKIYQKLLIENNNILTPKQAFNLYDTYGLPLEFLIQQVDEKKLSLDIKSVKKLIIIFKEQSRLKSKKTSAINIQNELFYDFEPTLFIGYDNLETNAKVIGKEDDNYVFDQTIFYATSGGQEHDEGEIENVAVLNVSKNSNGTFIHKLANQKIKIGTQVLMKVDKDHRRSITMNHSATHLAFSALEKVIGQKVIQVGSKITSSFFRFDFSYQGDLKMEQILEAQKIVNSWISKKTPTNIKQMKISEAKKLGANYFDWNKYKDVVRVVKLNNQVIDFCGGTHVKNLGEIEEILFYNLEKKGSGVYRIEGTSGREMINSKLLTLNAQIEQKLLVKNIAKIVELNKKDQNYNILNFNKVNEFMKEITKLSYTDSKWEIKVIKLIKAQENELNDLNNIVLEKIRNDLNDKFDENKPINLFVVNNFKAIDIAKITLTKFNDEKEKVFVIKAINDKKMTIVFVLTKDLVKNKILISDIKNFAAKYSLRGNGNNQLYIYGGKTLKDKNFNKDLLKWDI
ncbi:MAG: alanine--tRNA ligase [Mycoplasmataceae bacterium]|nr:alanine--tRNA ligase [Mycoplasmataceae bacterium]